MNIQLKKVARVFAKASGVAILAAACLLPLTANSWIGFYVGPGYGYGYYHPYYRPWGYGYYRPWGYGYYHPYYYHPYYRPWYY